MKVKDLPFGSILWSKNRNEDGEYDILGVMGMDMPEKYLDMECEKYGINKYDYELLEDICEEL